MQHPHVEPWAKATALHTHAVNRTCVDRWLAEAQGGYCIEAEVDQDCARADQGSFVLTSAEKESWPLAVAACAHHCASCQRCEHMSVSLEHGDCTWSYGPCARRATVAGFRSAPFRCAHRHSHRNHDDEEMAAPPAALNPAPLEAVSTAPLWLVVGVIVPPNVKVVPSHEELVASHRAQHGEAGLRFMHQSIVSRLNGTLAWQWVSAEAKHRADPRFTVVPCRDGPFHGSADDKTTAIASACGCKTILWFKRALHLFPRARFIAKAEDDSAVHDARIVAELRWAWGRFGSAAALWYGYFQWSGMDPSSRRNGWYCGEGDHLLGLTRTHGPPYCVQPRRTAGPMAANTSEKHGRSAHGPPWGGDSSEALAISPFASGGLDIRSRALAELVVAAGFDARFAHEWTNEAAHGGCEDYRTSCGNDEWAAACDALQGYLVARTLRAAARGAPWATDGRANVTALHLTMSKFHYPPPGLATAVMHAGELKGAKTWTSEPAGWRYRRGTAMLPIPFHLFNAGRGVGWEAHSPRHAATYRANKDLGCYEGDGGGDNALPCADIPTAAELALVDVPLARL